MFKLILKQNRFTQRKVSVFLFSILFIVLFLISGCGSGAKQPDSIDANQGGVLYIGVETPFYGLDALGGASGGVLLPDMATINSLIQEPLFRIDRSGRLIPVLGISATNTSGGRCWMIQLREGVFFHDGAAFNSDAVVQHWDRMLNSENNFRGRELFQPIKSVKKVDEYTVQFLLTHPWPSFLNVITDEQYICAFIPSPLAVKNGTQDQKPIGTGPFKYHAWNRDDHFSVIKNLKYWQKGKPVLNKVVFRTIPDHQTRYASMIAGELDAIVLDRGSLIRKAQKNERLTIYQSEGNGAEIVMVNTTSPPLDDVRVRRALALANKQDLHAKLIYGDAIPVIHQPFGEWFRCESVNYPEHNLAKAKQLINEYGKPVILECIHTNTSRGRQTGELLQQLYKKIGVTLNLKGLSTGPHVMKVMKKDYQLATWRILSGNDLGPQLYRILHSQSSVNYSGYKSEEMDKLLEAQSFETDTASRNKILCQIAALINEEIPFFYRGGRRYTILARKKIRNLIDDSYGNVNLATAWIDETINFNVAAYTIEQNAAIPEIDCQNPGDPDAVRAFVEGSWEGKDDWGAEIRLTFKENDIVTGQRTGSTPQTGKYIICGEKIFMKGRAEVELSIINDKLEGNWKKSGYTGNFTLEKISSS